MQVWGGATQKHLGKAEAEQAKVLKAMLGKYDGHAEELFAEAKVLRLQDIINVESAQTMRAIREEKLGTENLKRMDRGRRRGGAYAAPRPVDKSMKNWPSYSLPLAASKTEKTTGEGSRKRMSAAKIARYDSVSLDCEGEGCYCKARLKRFREWRKEREQEDGGQVEAGRDDGGRDPDGDGESAGQPAGGRLHWEDAHHGDSI